MPVNAGSLAWLLHSPLLEDVVISASKVSCNSLVSLSDCCMHLHSPALSCTSRTTTANISFALMDMLLQQSLCHLDSFWQAIITYGLMHACYPI